MAISMVFFPSWVWTSYAAPTPTLGLKTPANCGGPPPRIICANEAEAKARLQTAIVARQDRDFFMDTLLRVSGLGTPIWSLLNYKSRPCESSILEKSNEALIFVPLSEAENSAPFSVVGIADSPLAAFFGNKKTMLSIEPSALCSIFTSLGASFSLVRFSSRRALFLMALSSAD